MHKVAQDVYWTGYVDWDLRVFHGYATPMGSTYNAYIIKDEMPTLIDTVKHYGFDEMLGRIKDVIDPKEIRYIISNHTEMDHSGTIEDLLPLCPQAEVVCSQKGEETLKRHFKKDWPFKVVQDGESLNIGKRDLAFKYMPMVHWPESMATYSVQDKILYPNDAFGQHIASHQRFADELGVDTTIQEAAKYYANIVLPFGQPVMRVLDAIASLPIDIICPSHGLIWRSPSDVQSILEQYRQWSSHQTDNRVLIFYDTMWQSTERMAKHLYHLLDRNGIPVKLAHLENSHISDVITDIMFSKVVCVGTPMLNNRMLPTVAAMLMYMKGLKPKGRKFFTFGSYGWSKQGFQEVETSLSDAGMSSASPGLYVHFIPDENDLAQLNDWLPIIQNIFTE
jgi:flavorubredoxin